MKTYCLIVNTAIELRPHLGRMISYLGNNGWKGDIFCIGGEGKLPQILPEGSIERNVNIISTPTYDIGKLGRILEVGRQVLTFNKYKKNNSWDIIFACHPYSLLVAYLSNANANSELIYYPPELYDGKGLWQLRFCERITKDKISGVVNNQKERQKILEKKLNIDVPSIIIPNSTYDYYPVLQNNNSKNDREWNKPLKLLYQGTSNVERRCLREVIQVIGNNEEEVLLKLAVGGKSKYIEQIKELIKETSNPDRFIFEDFAPYPKHFKHTFDAHIGLMLYDPSVSLNYKYCSPNKLFEYPMLGLPVISSNQPHLKECIEENDFGICINPKSKDELSNAIERLYNFRRLKEMSKNARSWYLKNGNFKMHGNQLLDWLNEKLVT